MSYLIDKLPFFHRSRARYVMEHPQKELLNAAGVALYVSGIHRKLHKADDAPVFLGSRDPQSFLEVEKVKTLEPGNLVKLITVRPESGLTHFGVALEEAYVFSLNQVHVCTVVPFREFVKQYMGKWIEMYRKIGPL